MIFRGGTGNSLNRSLRFSHDQFLCNLNMGHIYAMDINWIESRRYCGPSVNLIGFGFIADLNVLADSDTCRNLCGRARYEASGWTFACAPYSKDVELSCGEERITTSVNSMFIMHNSQCGSHEVPCPYAKMDDGLFDVLILKPSCVLNLVPVLKGLPHGTHLNSSLVEYYKCENLEIVGAGMVNVSVMSGGRDSGATSVSTFVAFPSTPSSPHTPLVQSQV